LEERAAAVVEERCISLAKPGQLHRRKAGVVVSPPDRTFRHIMPAGTCPAPAISAMPERPGGQTVWEDTQ